MKTKTMKTTMWKWSTSVMSDCPKTELDPLPLYQPNLGPSFDGVWVGVTRTGFTREDTGYGLNLGSHVGDDPAAVRARRLSLSEQAGAPVLWLNQVHGVGLCVAGAQLAEDSLDAPPSADASLCMDSSTVLAIMTADCLPAVFVVRNTAGQAVGVAAAHAGWKGLLHGVLSKTALALAQQAGEPVAQVSAWLGPAIGPSSFEVGAEVREAFAGEFSQDRIQDAFLPAPGTGKYLANLYKLATLDLQQAGLDTVQSDQPVPDTFTDLNWFSHRRASRLGRQAGRMATLVRLLPR